MPCGHHAATPCASPISDGSRGHRPLLHHTKNAIPCHTTLPRCPGGGATRRDPVSLQTSRVGFGPRGCTYHTLVLATKPAPARGPRLRGGQRAPTAVGRPPGATGGGSRPQGHHHPVWHRSAQGNACKGFPIALRAIGRRRSEITISWRTQRTIGALTAGTFTVTF